MLVHHPGMFSVLSTGGVLSTTSIRYLEVQCNLCLKTLKTLCVVTVTYLYVSRLHVKHVPRSECLL